MTGSEAAQMVQAFTEAWPHQPFSHDEAKQVSRLLSAYDPSIVSEVIADRLEADLPRPGLAELSRVLRVYQPGRATDPEPQPTPTVPRRPWIDDMPEPPEIPANVSQLVAQAKTAAKVGFAAQQERTPPEPREITRGVVVPPEIWRALDHPSTRRTQDA